MEARTKGYLENICVPYSRLDLCLKLEEASTIFEMNDGSCGSQVNTHWNCMRPIFVVGVVSESIAGLHRNNSYYRRACPLSGQAIMTFGGKEGSKIDQEIAGK